MTDSMEHGLRREMFLRLAYLLVGGFSLIVGVLFGDQNGIIAALMVTPIIVFRLIINDDRIADTLCVRIGEKMSFLVVGFVVHPIVMIAVGIWISFGLNTLHRLFGI